MKPAQIKELLLQSLEHERGGIKVYETALKCVVNDDLEEDWEKYLDQTRNHQRTGEQKKVLQAAAAEVEDQDDAHLYHTKGWCRELCLQSLGLTAVLPPPEERNGCPVRSARAALIYNFDEQFFSSR